MFKNPYVLEFLGYPNFAELRESDLEMAIITHLQHFLLELGNGFAFVARQKHIRIEGDDSFRFVIPAVFRRESMRLTFEGLDARQKHSGMTRSFVISSPKWDLR